MADTATPNKDYLLQETGAHAGEWGQNLNDSVTSKIDTNLGGVCSKTLSNADVELTDDEAACALLRLNGTLSANVVVTTSAQGFFMVENLTSGSFTVSIYNGVGDAAVVLQGRRYLLFSPVLDGGEIQWISSVSSTAAVSVPIGTQMLFLQAAVPTGWTLYASLDDYGLVIASAGGNISGSVAWSGVFAQTGTGSTVLTTSTMPAHSHTMTRPAATSNPTANLGYFNGRTTLTATNITATLDNTGSGTAHGHDIDMRLKTVTTIAGTRTA